MGPGHTFTRWPVALILAESLSLAALAVVIIVLLTQRSFEASFAVQAGAGRQTDSNEISKQLASAADRLRTETSINATVRTVSHDIVQVSCRAEDRELVRAACAQLSRVATGPPNGARVINSQLSVSEPDASATFFLLSPLTGLMWLGSRLYLRRTRRSDAFKDELLGWQVGPRAKVANDAPALASPTLQATKADELLDVQTAGGESEVQVVFRVGGNPFRPDPQVLTASTIAQLRQLCAKLRADTAAHRVIRIASGVGSRYAKTHVTAQLGALLAEDSEARILMIEGDVDSPALHKVMRLEAPARLGLTEQIQRLLRQDLNGPVSVMRVDGNLHALVESRTSLPDALGLPTFARIVQDLRRQHDFIIIDGPVLDTWPDSQHLVDCVDDIIMVAAAGTRLRDTQALAIRHFPEEAVLSVIQTGDWVATA